MAKALEKIGNILVIILLIFFALIALLAVLTKFNVGPLRIYFVDSSLDSMGTTIKNGDLVIFKTTTPENIHTGDVIYFDRLGSPTAHRVIDIKGFCISTKGDNINIDPDAGCAQNISAKYLFKIPYLGFLFLGLKYLAANFAIGLRVIFGKA